MAASPSFSNYVKRRPFFFILGSVIALSLVYVLVALNRDFRAQVEKAMYEVKSAAVKIRLETDHYFKMHGDLFSAISSSACVLNRQTDACGSFFKRLNEDFPNIVNFAATDSEGRFFASGKPFDREKPPSVSHLPFFKALREGKEAFVMNPHIGPVSSVKVIGMVIPLRTAEGDFDGLLGASMKFEEIINFWGGLFHAQRESVLIVDRNQRIIAASDDFRDAVGKPIGEFGNVSAVLSNAAPDRFMLNGFPHRYHVETATLSEWSIIALKAGELTFANYARTNPWMPALAFLLAVVAAFAASMLTRESRFVVRLIDAEQNLRRHRDELEEIVAERTKELFKDFEVRKRAEYEIEEQSASLKLLHRIAVTANEAAAVDDAIRVALDEICTHTGWPVGHALVLDDAEESELVSTGIWHLDNPRKFGAFHEISEATRFTPGVGLPGRVLASKRPEWVSDVYQDDNFPRAKTAQNLGIGAGFAFPIMIEGDVLGILEFFSTDAMDPNPRLLEVMAQVSTQLGLVLRRKRADDALRASEQRFSRILEIAPGAIITVDANERIRVFNQNAETIFKWTADEVLGKPLDVLIPEEFRSSHHRHIKSFSEGHEEVLSVDRHGGIMGLRKDGTEFPAEASISKIQVGDDQIFIVLLRDVTERNRRERERDELQQQLHQAQKMEAVGQLAGGIAHDFNNILGAILGFSGFLEEDLDPDSPQHDFARRITQAGSAAQDMVAQILTFSRITKREFTSLNLVKGVEEAQELLRTTLPSSTKLETSIDLEDGYIEGNGAQITQVLMNLGVNGHDAIGGAQGTVWLSIDATAPDDTTRQALTVKAGEAGEAHVQITDLRDNGTRLAAGVLQANTEYLRIMVRDSGAGMPPSVMKQILEPFYTTKAEGKGTGLGLSVVHGIVISHGGALIVDSRPGKGTDFHIFLPRTTPGEGKAAPVATPPDLTNRWRIIVADDETSVADMLRIGFERLGHSVHVFHDGQSALDEFLTDPGAWDAVVTDQTMPNMTGMDLIGEIRTHRTDIPCIICTGFSENLTETSALKGGASAFCTKPVSTSNLSNSIAKLLETAHR